MGSCASRPFLSESILFVGGSRCVDGQTRSGAAAGKERWRLRSLQLLGKTTQAMRWEGRCRCRRRWMSTYGTDREIQIRQGQKVRLGEGYGYLLCCCCPPAVGGRGVWFVLCYCAHGNQWAFQDPGWLDYCNCINRLDHNRVLLNCYCSCFLVITYSSITPVPIKSVSHVPNAVAYSKTPFPIPNAEGHR